MASSSASSIQKRFKYDVFLSFRGEDTRKNFVDHLYLALHHKGIITYKDDERIKKGERISDQLMRSIEESRIYIIVFSKTYASSSWCLDELVKIMECQKTEGQTAYPIFYDVEPTEVRNQSGAVGEAFAKHEKKSLSYVLPLDCLCSILASWCNGSSSLLNGYIVNMENEDDVGRWRNALKEAASLVGMELKNNFNGHEARFVQEIVKEVSQKLNFVNSSIDGKLVGMETRVKNIVSSLEMDSDDVRIIGIKGMGGGGKTTLARAVFDHISIQFEGKSFVEDVREVSKGSMSGLKNLQTQVLRNVLNDKSIAITSVSDGKNIIRNMMRGRKILVVLDDVDDIGQLEALAGEPTWFKSGSRIIITTRDEQVLKAHGVKFIHEVSLLSYDEAIYLFSTHAFGREIPNHGYEELSRMIVHYAAGLPLTIKILGSFLCGRKELEWEDAIKRLRTIPLKETLEKLELSYNGLENDQKEIFLDIVCILKHKSKNEAIRILESCGFRARIGLSVLEQKSLITIYKFKHGDDDGRLLLHDHIEEMGMNIVRRFHPNEPKRHSRLWIPEEIEDILVNESGTEATKSIKMWNMNLHTTIIMKGLRYMRELRLLIVEDHEYREHEVDEVSLYLPEALQSLSWPSYPFCTLPESFQANKLINLEMIHSKISKLWEGREGKVFNKLKFLNLSGSNMRNLNLGMAWHLEQLILGACNDFVELQLPVECQNLKILNLCYSKVSNLNLRMIRHLEELDLGGCTNFVELQFPVEFPNLKILNLSGSKVSKLNLEMTPCLKILDLSRTKMSDLSLGTSRHLEELYLIDCIDFVELHFLVECPNLKILNLSCSKVSSLNLEMTQHLEELYLGGCDNFVELHFPIERPDLKILTFRASNEGSLNLELTPHLEKLNLHACSEFKLHMPVECQKLKDLNLMGSNVSYLNLGLTPNLEKLYLRECFCLQNIHAPVGSLKNLIHLRLDRCSGFVSFELNKHYKSDDPDSIATLDIDALCVRICPVHPKDKLPISSFKCSYDEPRSSWSGNLEKLISFDQCTCKNVEYLSSTINGLQHSSELTLQGSIPEDLWRLETLEHLCLWMVETQHLPNSIFMLKRLKSLRISFCWGIEQLPIDICRLDCLKTLDINGCPSLRDIPYSICKMKCLKRLYLTDCCHVEYLPEELGYLELLEELHLAECESLQDIPNSICNIKCLKSLDLSDCIQVGRLPEKIGRLECLEELDINGSGISRLPQSIYQLKGLTIVGSIEQLESCGFTSLTETISNFKYCYKAEL